jgi:hypothetical protein
MKGHVFDFTGNSVFVGRSSRNDIQVNDIMVSRKHLKIFRTAKAFFVEDLRSANGTFLNGELVKPGEACVVRENDTIVVGNSSLQVGGIVPSRSPEPKNPHSAAPIGKPRHCGNPSGERRSRSARNLQLIYRASELLEQPLNINEVLAKMLESLLDTLPRIDRAAVLLFEKDKIKELMTRSRKGSSTQPLRYSRPLLGRVVKSGKPVKISNTTYESQSQDPDSMNTLQIRSALCVPMMINTQVGGAVYVDSPRGPHDGTRKEDLLLLNSLSGFVAAAIENARLHPE